MKPGSSLAAADRGQVLGVVDGAAAALVGRLRRQHVEPVQHADSRASRMVRSSRTGFSGCSPKS